MKRSKVGHQEAKSQVIIIMPETQHIGNDTHESTADETAMLKTLSPLITSMKIFGLFFLKDNENIASNSSNRSRWSLPKFSSKGHAYAFTVLVVMWLNVIRFATVFTANDNLASDLLWKISFVVFTLMHAFVQVSCYRACSSGRMLMLLQTFYKKFTLDIYKCIRVKVILYVIAAWICAAINVVVFGYILLSSKENIMDVTLAPIRSMVFPDYTIVIYMRVLYLVIHFYVVGAATFPMAFNLLVATIFSQQFTICNRKFREAIENSDFFKESFEDLRRQHQVLSRLVSKADKFMCLSNAAYVGGLIFLVISNLYSLLFNPLLARSPIFLSLTIFWLLWTASGLVVVSFGGIIVNHSVS